MTGRRADVSVVVPAWNARTFLGETLDSLLSQDEPPLEVIVVDDGSPDDTATAFEGYHPTVRVLRQENAGVSVARNRGVARARGDCVAFCDHDDTWEPEALALRRDRFDHSPQPGVVFCQARVVAPAESRTREELIPSFADPGDRLDRPGLSLFLDNYVPLSTAMVATGLARSFPFRPEYRLAEDWDLWLRLAAAGTRFAYVPRPLVRYIHRPGRLTERMADLRLEDLRAAEDHLAALPDLRRDHPRQVAGRLAALHREAGYHLAREGRWREARPHLRAALRDRPLDPGTLVRLLRSLFLPPGGTAH
jgi:glycosyltransferase involved in cell wall biosynthesis